MSTEVTIAIITAVASLLVAGVSLINSMISSRHSSRTAEVIETLKSELANKAATREMSDRYLVKSVEALDALIQATQRVKDMVHLIVNATDDSLDTESAMKGLSEARDHLFECYEDQVAHLEPELSKGAHRAKNQVYIVEVQLTKYLDGAEFVSELSDEQRQTLVELRNELTDAQNLLRDSRSSKLLKRIKEI